MIVKMKKVLVVTPAGDTYHSLTALRQLGVIHVQPVREPPAAALAAPAENYKIVMEALQILKDHAAAHPAGEAAEPPAEDPLATARRVQELVEHRRNIEAHLHTLALELERLAPLGDFDPSDFTFLQQKGLYAKIYVANRKDFEHADLGTAPVFTLARRDDTLHLLAVDTSKLDLPFTEFALPAHGSRRLEAQRADLQSELQELNAELAALTPQRRHLRRALHEVEAELTFTGVQAGMGTDGPLAYLAGYCPSSQLGRLRELCAAQGLGLYWKDPPPGEHVPTLIQNPRWLRVIEPVFRFMGTLPGYREFDVSFWFLLSLSLFFAMLVGDGGYGLLFLAGTWAARRRLPDQPSEPFMLMYIFSGATVLWGLVTGTWFGLESLTRLPFLDFMVVPQLYSYSANQDFMLSLCFLLGAVHLSLARIIRGLRLFPAGESLAELGWIGIVWFLYFLAGHLVLGESLPPFATPLLAAGLVLAAVFATPQRGWLKSTLLGLADLPLSIIRAFSDLVSYLRLYAVGYATLVVAVSFNQMAADLGWATPLGLAGAALTIFAGHALNIALAAMAVVVHGIRLNMLEFSSHLGMEWNGRPYEPFRPGMRP